MKKALVTALSRTTPRCRRRLAVEVLEGRTLPTGIAFNFFFNDPAGLFAPHPELLDSFQAAGQILSSFVGGQGSLEVVIQPNNSIPRATGTTVAVLAVASEPGFAIVESGVLIEALTGVDPNDSDPDIRIEINTQSYLPTVWFDPSGAARTEPVPPGQLDFLTVALHEIIHALGMQGYREVGGPAYGSFTVPFKTTYDVYTDFGSGGDPNVLYFNGPAAAATYGGPVPLTSVGPSHFLTGQNFFHLGNPPGVTGEDLIPDLMNGVQFVFGTRYAPSSLDLAILADLGWPAPLAKEPAPPAVQSLVFINDGAAQRSLVTSITVFFTGLVTIDPSAFQVHRLDGTLVGVDVYTGEYEGWTWAYLVFSGEDVVAGSLVDGIYSLTVLGDLVHDDLGRPLDGDGDGLPGGDRLDGFFRLFGDSDGDGDVDGDDYLLLESAFGLSTTDPAFLGYFDHDSDGSVDDLDWYHFFLRFGISLFA